MSTSPDPVELAQLQNELADMWNTHGPDRVQRVLRDLDTTTLSHLVMLNVGASALRRG